MCYDCLLNVYLMFTARGRAGLNVYLMFTARGRAVHVL